MRAVEAGELLPVSVLGEEFGEETVTVAIAVAPELVPTDLATGSLVDVWVVGEDRRSGQRAAERCSTTSCHRRPGRLRTRSDRRAAGQLVLAVPVTDEDALARGARRERGQPRPRPRQELIAVICVVILAAGEAWESPVLADLEQHRDIVVLKRCVDVDDLLASVTSGQADVAVVSPGSARPRPVEHHPPA